MSRKTIAVAIALLFASTLSTFAATVKGWITYIALNKQELLLGSTDMYAVAPNVDLSSVAIGDQVQLNVESRGGRKVVTRVTKVPFDPTSS
ncbi:MAG TPA: hypothetical protein VG798_02865 [Rhizomicrobium sp.]|nr:hypothetical protein [Rhizomicrobium sp.]